MALTTDAQPAPSARPIQQPLRHDDAATRGNFPFSAGGPRHERLVFGADGQLIVPLNEWHRLMHGVGATRTRETYLAVLRPWFGFLGKHGYAWNARPVAVRECTRLFMVEADCVLQGGVWTAGEDVGPYDRAGDMGSIQCGRATPAVARAWPCRRRVAPWISPRRRIKRAWPRSGSATHPRRRGCHAQGAVRRSSSV
jgi:hypothetical protein